MKQRNLLKAAELLLYNVTKFNTDLISRLLLAQEISWYFSGPLQRLNTSLRCTAVLIQLLVTSKFSEFVSPSEVAMFC